MSGNILIFASADIVVGYRPKQSDTIFITFGHFHTKIDNARFWGDEFLERCGYASIGFVSASSDWYPEDYMPDALAAARACIARSGCSRVVCYGLSMGAYGALRYAAALNADIAIAFNPQSSINPAFAPHQAHLQNHRRSVCRDEQVILPEHLAKENFIIFDPQLTSDCRCANIIKDLGNVRLIPFQFTHHYSMISAVECAIMHAIISSILMGRADVARDLRKLFRNHRKKSATFWLQLALTLQHRGRSANAVSHAYHMALRCDPRRTVAHIGLALEAARLGATADVNHHLRARLLSFHSSEMTSYFDSAPDGVDTKVNLDHDLTIMCHLFPMIEQLPGDMRSKFQIVIEPIAVLARFINENPYLRIRSMKPSLHGSL